MAWCVIPTQKAKTVDPSEKAEAVQKAVKDAGGTDAQADAASKALKARVLFYKLFRC